MSAIKWNVEDGFECTECRVYVKNAHACLARGMTELLCDRCHEQLKTEVTPICDFCSGRPVKWTYPAMSFRTPHSAELMAQGVVSTSVDDWAACQTCYELIEADQWEALAQWSEARFYLLNPEVPRSVGFGQHLRALHAKFRDFRTGKAYKDGGWK